MGELDLPLDVFLGAPFQGQVFLEAITLAGGSAPGGPVVGNGERGSTEQQQNNNEKTIHGVLQDYPKWPPSQFYSARRMSGSRTGWKEGTAPGDFQEERPFHGNHNFPARLACFFPRLSFGPHNTPLAVAA